MRVHRSRTNRWIGGVCGGLAENMGINPLWLRLLFVITGGVLFWVYLILWIVLPES